MLDVVSPDEVKPLVTRWLEQGLPLPRWAEKAYGKSFETNPYLPTNGYGEIVVDLPVHRDLRPTDVELEIPSALPEDGPPPDPERRPGHSQPE